MGIRRFPNNRLNNQQKNNSIFDNANVKNLWIELGGRRYPEESLNLDWDADHYCLAYKLSKAMLPYVDLKDFKKSVSHLQH